MNAPLLLIAGLIALAGWLVCFVLAATATASKEVEPAAPTLDLGGDEPPALVNLLTGYWKISRDAMPATLLDLAARRFIEIQEVGPNRVLCHIRQKEPAGLLPYERRVLDRLRSLEVDGVVPADALTTGQHQEKWWLAFRRDVIADAKARGLSRDRWSMAIMTAFGILAVAPAALLAFWIHENAHSTSGKDPRLGLVIVLWCGLMYLFRLTRDQRDTPKGREVAARWLGLRDHLAMNPVLPTLGPGAVALWDRIFAYAAAMGLADRAVHAIPMSREDDHEAWSSYGSAWRRVTVRYPRLRPAWGWSPGHAVVFGLGWIAIALFILVMSNLFRSAADGSEIGLYLALFGWTLAVACVIALVVWGRVLWFAILDLAGPENQVEGQVIRLRTFGSKDKTRFYCAVYTGTGHQVDAWSIGSGLYRGLSQMSHARVRVTPRLGCVRSIEVLDTP
jgi:hypothetical protein